MGVSQIHMGEGVTFLASVGQPLRHERALSLDCGFCFFYSVKCERLSDKRQGCKRQVRSLRGLACPAKDA